ncbi:hypothetical protein [Hymenobacter coccineus]|uniref:Uncharacterized protein n=1 Tax=Hymenobacter coccineus TaxID=1908235 RepID=A0A1G1TKV9_9BACT|nr:hypothetical protein [Hymenobacter coccineus]OGX91485.1 hypothetical protein BEN49_04750 [Hymenobacter coccineus]
MYHFSSLPLRAILTGLLLSSCSQSAPTANDSAATTAPSRIAPAKRTAPMKVDSLNGIPGHHFGEPLAAFPGLKARGSNALGMKSYYYPSGQSAQGDGWFGKHAQQLTTSYYFIDGKFAYFTTTTYGVNRDLFKKEAEYLFGAGERYRLDGVIWQGKQTRAVYTRPFSDHGPSAQLDIVSEPLEAQAEKAAATQLKAENSVQ